MIIVPAKRGNEGTAGWFHGGGYRMSDMMEYLTAGRQQARRSLASRILELADEHCSPEDASLLRAWLRAKGERLFSRTQAIPHGTLWYRRERALAFLHGLVQDDCECQRILATQSTRITSDGDTRDRKSQWPTTRMNENLRTWLLEDERRERDRLHHERKMRAFKEGRCQMCFREPAGQNGECRWCRAHAERVAKRRLR